MKNEYMDKNYVNLCFRILKGRNIDESLITKPLGLIPGIVFKGGQSIDGNQNHSKITGSDGVVFVCPNSEGKSFQEQMDYFLNTLETKISILRTYNNYTCEFLCIVFLSNREAPTPWIHFDERYNAFITATGTTFNLKICFSPTTATEAFYESGF